MNTTLRMKIVVRAPSPGEPRIEVPPPKPAQSGASTDPHEFLSMRARQREVRARARRWKRTAGVLIAAALVVAAATAPRWSHRALAAVRVHMPAHRPAVSVASAATAPASTTAQARPAVIAVAEPVAPAAPADESASTCEDSFGQHQWRAAVESCTKAFAASPSAALALRVAHAHWSRAEAAEGGSWAARALELGSEDPDAYVLIGHAERAAGHREEAMAAYRRYLRRAPHGWNAPRVRAALRELSPAPDVPVSSDISPDNK